jgi:hypothetical protein
MSAERLNCLTIKEMEIIEIALEGFIDIMDDFGDEDEGVDIVEARDLLKDIKTILTIDRNS